MSIAHIATFAKKKRVKVDKSLPRFLLFNSLQTSAFLFTLIPLVFAIHVAAYGYDCVTYIAECTGLGKIL
jgi:hypothetical protein